MKAQRPRGLRHVAINVGQHPLNVFPLDPRQRGYRSRLSRRRAVERRDNPIPLPRSARLRLQVTF